MQVNCQAADGGENVLVSDITHAKCAILLPEGIVKESIIFLLIVHERKRNTKKDKMSLLIFKSYRINKWNIVYKLHDQRLFEQQGRCLCVCVCVCVCVCAYEYMCA